ncbi:cytochrome b/b6 domain-containing protein [Roseomonas sp. OT10]|uniref:cytochrome b/b6 domain-containing protein n=1 Tax=Roseomonas cutis TaxID=2897332 RepID=UPI001E5F5260|nr:cytochrome b/b6 domain-containing protein [Roseomonas sp. OT10]UFN50024.1 cytochrome b/b6 domain-containing protein [Roseomonas sp. OT10]
MTTTQESRVPVRVWDGWVRLTHWVIALLLPLSWWSGTQARWELHFLSGFTILALVLFRLAWGLVGSDTARFTRFLRPPLEGLRHLSHLTRREPDTELGHNAAGGWMVLVLLGLLLLQTVTGLMADDQILTRGPLAARVPPAVSDQATAIHLRAYWFLLAAAGLHVLAVLAYALLKRQDLVRPMVTGVKRLPAGFAHRAPRLGSPVLGAVLLAAAAAAVWGISQLG